MKLITNKTTIKVLNHAISKQADRIYMSDNRYHFYFDHNKTSFSYDIAAVNKMICKH